MEMGTFHVVMMAARYSVGVERADFCTAAVFVPMCFVRSV